nr:hypothetical protein [Tanacetum cinerariifolium]
GSCWHRGGAGEEFSVGFTQVYPKSSHGSDEKFSQMLTQLESQPEYGGGSGSGG